MAALAFCVIMYDGGGQPPPFDRQLRAGGEVYLTGAKHTVTAELAGKLLRAAPKGTIKVLEGEPAEVATLPGTARHAAKLEEEHRRRFPVDPTKALDGVDELPKEVLSGVSGKLEDALAFVEGGKADKVLGALALWAKLGRRDAEGKLVAACCRRAEVLAAEARRRLV